MQVLIPNGLRLGRLPGDNARRSQVENRVVGVIDIHKELALLRAHNRRITRLRARLQPGQHARAHRKEGDADPAEKERFAAPSQRIVNHADIA